MKQRQTQRQRVLQALQEANGRPVPGYELARVGGLQFQTRVWELRHVEGHSIRCNVERKNGEVHSTYSLISPEKKQQALFQESKLEKGQLGVWSEAAERRIE